MVNTVVKLPLNREIQYALTSGNYNDITLEMLSHLDLIYTFFFRYPRLVTTDVLGSDASQGFTIDFTQSHPAAAIGTTILVGFIGSIGAWSMYKKKKESHANKFRATPYSNTYEVITNQLSQTPSVEPSAISTTFFDNETSQRRVSLSGLALEDSRLCERVAFESKMDKVNDELAALLEEDNKLKEKYKFIKIENDHIEVVLKEKELTWAEKAGQRVLSIAKSSWVTMGLCSFVYWILWIGTGVITGNFDVGIKALGAAAFAVPAAIAAIYPAIKTRNWWKNNFDNKAKNSSGESVVITEKRKLTYESISDLAALLRKLAFNNERKRLEAELSKTDRVAPVKANLEPVLAHDELTLSLGQNKWRKTAATFLEKTISTYIGAQYIAWVSADFLKIAANVTLNLASVTLGLGIATLAASVIYGGYQAYKQHQKVKQYKAETDSIVANLNTKKMTLDAAFLSKQKEIDQLKQDILAKNPDSKDWVDGQVKSFNMAMNAAPKSFDPHANKESNLKKIASLAYAFLNGITGGAMIGRAALIVGTVTLPIFVFALANPYTIGIIAALGLIYGSFKAYQHYQAKKESQAKALLEQRQEKIESLSEQINLADLQIEVLKAKLETLDQNSGLKQDSQPQAEPSVSAPLNTDPVNEGLYSNCTATLYSSCKVEAALDHNDHALGRVGIFSN